jgi:Fe-S cluster assembly iron-binding protein IscA
MSGCQVRRCSYSILNQTKINKRNDEIGGGFTFLNEMKEKAQMGIKETSFSAWSAPSI